MNIVIGWPELIYLGLSFLGLGIILAEGNGRKIIINLISLPLVLGLLYWGGFFS